VQRLLQGRPAMRDATVVVLHGSLQAEKQQLAFAIPPKVRKSPSWPRS
jgi:HrpA-like RNA helicase